MPGHVLRGISRTDARFEGATILGYVWFLQILRDFDVPLYDGDVETAEGIPAGAQELRRRLLASDAFIISSPEYNGSMPGTIKNLIDWTSRFRPQPFDGRHGLLLSASPSLAGGNRGLWALRMPLEHLGARIFPDMFSLAMAHKAFAGDELADAALRARFEKNLQAFLSLAEAAKHYPCMKTRLGRVPRRAAGRRRRSRRSGRATREVGENT